MLGVAQIVLGVVVARETAAWKRIAGVLFILNGTTALGNVADWLAPSADATLFFDAAETATGPLLILLAFVYPKPAFAPRRMRALIWTLCGLAVLGGLVAVLLPREFRFPFTWIATFLGYASFLGYALPRTLRSEGLLEPGSEWIIAGFAVRVVEFVPRYAGSATVFLSPSEYSPLIVLGACAWLVLFLSSVYASFRVLRASRDPHRRVSAELIGLAFAAGFFLGLAQNPWLLPSVKAVPAIGPPSTATSSPTLDFLSTLSVEIIRPLFVSVGLLGLRRVENFLAPIGFGGAFAIAAFYGLPAFAGADYPTSVIALIATSASMIGVVLGLSIVRKRSDESDAGSAMSSAEHPAAQDLAAEPPRWPRLVIALEGSSKDTQKPDERRSRQGLAAHLGVSPRNLHRIVEQANTTGASLLGEPPGTLLISWSLTRGRSGRLKYYYRLTARGEERLETVRRELYDPQDSP